MKKNLVWFAVFLIAAAAAMRVLRNAGFIHLPPNVAPIAALAMFGGAYLPRRFAIAIPLAAMLFSDLLIGFYTPAVMGAVYLSFAASSAIGFWFRSHRGAGNIIAGTLVGSMFFFVVTNAAVWIFEPYYPHTLAGLAAAYLAGIPFFRNTVVGDLAYTGIMFGAYEYARYAVRKRETAAQFNNS